MIPLTAVALLLGGSPAARADGAADAKDLFERGRALRAGGDCAGAAPLFRKAYEVYPTGLGSLRNLAECEESLSHWASAKRAWLDLKRGLVVDTSKKYDGWDVDADAAATRLAPKVARLTIHVVGVEAAAAHVTLNDEPIDAVLIDTPLERDPGSYVVRARATGGAPTEQRLSLAAGDAQNVELRVIPPPKPQVVEQPPTAGSGPTPTHSGGEPGGGSPNKAIGWVGISLGAAALVGAGISLGVRQAAMDSVDSQCPSHASCSSSLQPTVSRGQTASTLVTALGIGGVVALGIGIVLVVTSPKERTRAMSMWFDGREVTARWTF